MGQAAIWIKYINAWFPDFLLSSFHLFPPLPWFPILPPILIPSVVKNVLVRSKPFNHGFHGYDLD